MSRKKKIKETTNGMISDHVEEATGNTSPQKTILQEINEMRASGKVGTSEFTSKMRQLEVVLGVSQISPFGTNELEIFEENLAEMSLSDMQKLAHKIGVNPYVEKPNLKKSLIREFSAYTKNSRRNIMPSTVQSFVVDPNEPKHQKLIKILGDI
jgi:hypothetical protein